VKAIDPKEVNTFLDTIVAALDGNQDKLRQSIDDLAVVAFSLGSRDAAIGRLIGNLNTVTGAIDERDAQIRTVLDNLVLISQTFSQNTGVLSTAVDQLGDFSKNFGGLLADNRTQVNNIIGNLNTILDEVKLKLPVLDSTLAGLDEAAKRIFTSSRYGEWLNQVIPCGSIAGVFNSNSPCITGAPSAGLSGGSTSQSSQPPPARGSQALTQLFTGGAGQ
jgi:ABC-type transporter Mla subunit MlaD